ncbi:MAG TPA: hypothetical protein VE863_21290 [Pyrinomonadaceae bacterium]|jgi:hypothetical protein|nr:hypothetical protein [Pyrinomonadaceae bacterium]
MATNPKDYVSLRTLLDSLEVGALRFFLSSTSKSQSQKLRYLKGKLTPIVKELWREPQARKGALLEMDCPPGYFDCLGLCVPYPCQDGGANLSAAKKTTATKKR